MKRIFTLLWLTITALSFKATAQTGTSCNAEFSVQFLSNSTVQFNPVLTEGLPFVQPAWNFGDGSPVNNLVSPTHSYALPGTYTVVHTITRVNPNGGQVCVQSFTKVVTIAPECNLVVDFNWTSAAANPLTIAFHNLTVPLSPTDSITWQFGDNMISHDVNPVHTYANAGTYNVCLIVKKFPNTSNTPCIKYICKTVVVQAPCNLVVDFSWNATATNPLMVEFHNLSTPLSPADSSIWSFGDGTSSTVANPVHTYTSGGVYTVCLTVKKISTVAGTPPCVRTICKTITVTTPCNLVVDFSWNITTTNPLMVEFHNLSTPLSPTDSITWQFGDNTISHDVNPVHTYANAGTYNVCLIVKKNDNPPGTTPCIRYICKTVTVQAPCTLVANFTWHADSAIVLKIWFANTSTPVSSTDSIRWTFGDGTSSNQYSPDHTYSQPGTYTVCLRMQKRGPNGTVINCVSEICKTVIVTQPCTLVVDFSWNITATNPLMVEFHNLSTPLSPTDSITWQFGDNTISHDVNPVHTYANAGTYNVCLIVKKYPYNTSTACVRYICKTVVIPLPCNLVVDFSWHPATTNPLTIEFTNLSTPLAATDSITWTFGDGASSHDVNPAHTYANAGTYNVCLVVKKNNNPPGTTPCIRYICKTIVVTQPCNFQPDFSWQLDSINHKKVYFTNLTIVPTAAAIVTWYFGDGATATSWNAVHEYAQPGRYYVCLKVQLSNTCIRYKCDSITVPVPLPPCNNQSNFTVLTASTNSQTFTFIPVFQNTIAQYTWTFGDGTGSHDMIATHHYAQAGTYTACLTVWRSAACASTTCQTLIVHPQFNCDSAHVSFSYQADPQVSNKIYFYANTNVPILDQTWTITRLPAAAGTTPVTLHQNNPTYLFQDTGYYRVCLRAITLGGCIKEYCSVIHIEHVANACELQAYPNPASTVVNVIVSLTQPQMIDAYVYNSVNVLVIEKHQQGVTGNNILSININSLPAGPYTIKLIYGNHTCYARFQKM